MIMFYANYRLSGYLFFLFVYGVFLAHNLTSGVITQKTNKIVEGVDKVSTERQELLENDGIMRDPFSGPTSLSFLDGQCFSNAFDRHDYTICPFQNVTYKRITAAKMTMIGLWGQWQLNKDGATNSCYNEMVYRDGKSCGDEKMVTRVKLKCAHESFGILSVDDKAHCSYVLELGLPIACSLLNC